MVPTKICIDLDWLPRRTNVEWKLSICVSRRWKSRPIPLRDPSDVECLLKGRISSHQCPGPTNKFVRWWRMFPYFEVHLWGRACVSLTMRGVLLEAVLYRHSFERCGSSYDPEGVLVTQKESPVRLFTFIFHTATLATVGLPTCWLCRSQTKVKIPNEDEDWIVSPSPVACTRVDSVLPIYLAFLCQRSFQVKPQAYQDWVTFLNEPSSLCSASFSFHPYIFLFYLYHRHNFMTSKEMDTLVV